MKRKLLIGILVFLGIAMMVLNPLVCGILAVVVWIYLFRMVRKQKNSVSDDQMEFKIPECHLKKLKALLIVAGISFLIFLVSAIVHNILHGLAEFEESVYFLIAIVALLVFIVATAGSMVIFLKGRQKTS